MNVLVLTYHVKKCKRIGGFHSFIKFLVEDGHNVDWVTTTMSLSWAFNKNDKENIKNLFSIWKGINYKQADAVVRHFASPVIIPAKLARYINKKLYYHYWISWKRLRRRLKSQYDIILLETSACQYIDELVKEYPTAKIIYRPSDILKSVSIVPEADEMELRTIEKADITLCVDESELDYYRNLGASDDKMCILRNPTVMKTEVDFLHTYQLKNSKEQSIVHVGVSQVDFDLIEYTADQIKEAVFYIIGPFEQPSHDNVFYLGAMKENQFQKYLENAKVGICPISGNDEDGFFYGYTKKVCKYMKYLLPVVATRSTNYLNVEGFETVKSKEEFVDKVRAALKLSESERALFRQDYIKVLSMFTEEKIKKQFLDIIKENNYYEGN